MHLNRRRPLPINSIHTRSRNHRRIPSLEALEERVVLSPTIFTVTSIADGTSRGTLRWAIKSANANPKSAGSIIEFSPSVFKKPRLISLTDGTLDLTETKGPEVIQGPTVGVTISGSHNVGGSVFYIERETADVHASLSGLTITGGRATFSGFRGEGGGILNLGYLTLSDCTVKGNYAHFAGGIQSGNQLTLNDCTISGNTAKGGAGGIYCHGLTAVDSTISDNSTGNRGGGISSGGGTLKLTGCTISGNSSVFDAGIYSANPTTLTNCTISGNSASSTVGGLYLGAAFTIHASTISGNSAGTGTGCGLNVAYDAGGARTLVNTIIAGNTSGSSRSPSDLAATSAGLVRGSFNLIGPGGSAGIVNGSNGNIVLTSLPELKLAPLANNGGPTETMALLPGSVAINNGTFITGLTTDQRGKPLDRPRPDIGAYQSQGYILSVVAGSTPQSTNGGSSFSDPLAVMLTQNGTNLPKKQKLYEQFRLRASEHLPCSVPDFPQSSIWSSGPRGSIGGVLWFERFGSQAFRRSDWRGPDDRDPAMRSEYRRAPPLF